MSLNSCPNNNLSFQSQISSINAKYDFMLDILKGKSIIQIREFLATEVLWAFLAHEPKFVLLFDPTNGTSATFVAMLRDRNECSCFTKEIY